MRHLLRIENLTNLEAEGLLKSAALIKKRPASVQNVLKGKSFVLIFEKPSTRTWASFDIGIQQMGGRTLYLGPEDIQLGKREETKDVARVLARYVDGAVMRTFKQGTIEEFAQFFEKPVINGLSDEAHPCQALADFLTLQENFGRLKGLTLAFIGDANNVLESLMFLGAKTGVNIHCACPKSYSPKEALIRRVREAAKSSGSKVTVFTDPKKAVQGAHALYTDVWVSMGEERIAARKRKAFRGFQIDLGLLALANKNAIVLHCLPAHRGEEITNEVMESKQSRIFDQAENRLHAQKAVLKYLYCSSRPLTSVSSRASKASRGI